MLSGQSLQTLIVEYSLRKPTIVVVRFQGWSKFFPTHVHTSSDCESKNSVFDSWFWTSRVLFWCFSLADTAIDRSRILVNKDVSWNVQQSIIPFFVKILLSLLKILYLYHCVYSVIQKSKAESSCIMVQFAPLSLILFFLESEQVKVLKIFCITILKNLILE